MVATIAKGFLNGRFCGTLLLLSANDQMQGRRSERMARPVIFTISAAWDNEARSGQDIATTFRRRPTRRRSTNCWRKSPPRRSICCPTITPESIREIYFCKSLRCAKLNQPLGEWRRNSTRRCALGWLVSRAWLFGIGTCSVTLRCERSEPRRATAQAVHPSRAASRPPQDDGSRAAIEP